MKFLPILKFVLAAISVVLVLVFFLGWVDVDAMLIWNYVLLALAIALIIILPAINMIKNPKGAIGSLIGLAIIVVLSGITYAMASDTPVVNSGGGFFEDAMTLKLTDVGLYLTYISLAAAVLVAVLGEVRNALK